jgi:hypothetical protein
MMQDMSGLKVKCSICKQIVLETTDKYNPDVMANGSMVKKLVPWIIDWQEKATTLAAEMICPKCGVGQLAPKGRLTVVMAEKPTELKPEAEGDGVCDSAAKDAACQSEQAIPDTPETVATDDTFLSPGESKFICETCGRVCKTEFGLNGHKKSHKKKKKK